MEMVQVVIFQLYEGIKSNTHSVETTKFFWVSDIHDAL